MRHGKIAVYLPVQDGPAVLQGYSRCVDSLEAVFAEEDANDGSIWQVELILHHDLIRLPKKTEGKSSSGKARGTAWGTYAPRRNKRCSIDHIISIYHIFATSSLVHL